MSRSVKDALDSDSRLRSGVVTLLAATLLTLAGQAPAAEYRPPVGFNGHVWDEPLTASKGLTLWRVNTALNARGKMTDVSVNCRPDEPATCTLDQTVQGDGSFAAAEYYFEKDRNPWVAQRVELSIISYLYCTRWDGDYMPHAIGKKLKLCGVRIMFHSDSSQQLAKRGDHYESNFDRVLRELIAEFGAPPGYERTPTITIEAEDQRLTTPEKAKPEYVRYRWCGVEEHALRLHPACRASVTLAFEATSGEGTILYAAAPLYDYANARHVTGDDNNELYVLLSGRPLDRPFHYEKQECTGTLICAPRSSRMSARELKAFQP